MTISTRSKSPAVKIRPSAMVTPEYPPPQSENFQTSGGPLFGHCFRRPVSGEMLVRPAPWKSGQLGALSFLVSAESWAAPRPMPASTMSVAKLRVAFMIAPELRWVSR
jgi:uncharacterized membrane protein